MWRANSLEKTLMLAKIEDWRRRGRQRMIWLDGIPDSMDMNLSKLWEMVKHSTGLCRVGHNLANEQQRQHITHYLLMILSGFPISGVINATVNKRVQRPLWDTDYMSCGFSYWYPRGLVPKPSRIPTSEDAEVPYSQPSISLGSWCRGRLYT